MSSRQWPAIILVVLLVLSSGCLDSGEPSSPVLTREQVPPETTIASANYTALAPTLTATQPPAETATDIPTADLPIAPVEGARAPDFTLADLHGKKVSLSDLRGHPVLLNFRATW